MGPSPFKVREKDTISTCFFNGDSHHLERHWQLPTAVPTVPEKAYRSLNATEAVTRASRTDLLLSENRYSQDLQIRLLYSRVERSPGSCVSAGKHPDRLEAAGTAAHALDHYFAASS